MTGLHSADVSGDRYDPVQGAGESADTPDSPATRPNVT
jgi:hypothetical protein